MTKFAPTVLAAEIRIIKIEVSGGATSIEIDGQLSDMLSRRTPAPFEMQQEIRPSSKFSIADWTLQFLLLMNLHVL